MPQSLVYELIDQLGAGTPLLTSLNRAIFQAKWNLGEEPPEVEDGKKHFQIWKVNMRGLDDGDPVYVAICFIRPRLPSLSSEKKNVFDI